MRGGVLGRIPIVVTLRCSGLVFDPTVVLDLHPRLEHDLPGPRHMGILANHEYLLELSPRQWLILPGRGSVAFFNLLRN